jgi:hypothetical protein
MVEENQHSRQGLQAAFSSEEQKRYWLLWHEHQGSSSRVANVCGVRSDTVQEHVLRVVKSLGFDGIKQAKTHYGFKSSSVHKYAEVNSSDLKKLLEMQGYRCALSGVRLEPKNAELDHKIPLSRGGTNDLGNLQWLARDVNRAKGTMDNEEFIAMCRIVGKV